FAKPLPVAGAAPPLVPAAAALHDHGRSLLERIDPNGEIADHVFIDPHRPLEFGDRGGRRVDIKQDVMPLSVFSHSICEISQTPIFTLFDLAAVVDDKLGKGIGEGIDLRAGDVLASDKYIFI